MGNRNYRAIEMPSIPDDLTLYQVGVILRAFGYKLALVPTPPDEKPIGFSSVAPPRKDTKG